MKAVIRDSTPEQRIRVYLRLSADNHSIEQALR